MSYPEQKVKDLLGRREVDWKRVYRIVEVGSSAHGLSTSETDDDFDATVIRIEQFDELVLGPQDRQSMMIRTQPDGHRSRAGDIDLNVYTLRKFAGLASKGNPSILAAIFSTKVCRDNGHIDFDQLARIVASKKAGGSFLGYMRQQLERWKGERGQKNVNRPELVEAYGFDCYDERTEFLTDRGWLRFDEVEDGDRLATINPVTKQMEWQGFLERHEAQVDSVLSYRSRNVKWVVSENHRMYVDPAPRMGPKVPPVGLGEWQFKSAREVKYGNPRTYLQVVAPKPSMGFDAPYPDHLLTLIGLYVSEGSVAKRRNGGSASVLAFDQYEDGKAMEHMESLRGVYREGSDQGWYIQPREDKGATTIRLTVADRDLAQQVVEWCGDSSKTKRLPEWIIDLNARQAQIILDSACAGDGTRHRSGGWVYYTISKELADGIQTLALIAGKGAKVWGPYPSGMYQVRIVDTPTSMVLYPRKIKHEKVRTRVVCFTVPNETLVTRFKGTPAFHGNTKYAAHIIRLGYQGIEYMKSGRFTMPMPEAEEIVALRTGSYDEASAMQWAELVERALKKAIDDSRLPDHPGKVESWLVGHYKAELDYGN